MEVVGHYRMAVSFHTVGSEQKEMNKMIEDHPEVTFIAAHPGDKEQYLLHLERIKNTKIFTLTSQAQEYSVTVLSHTA